MRYPYAGAFPMRIPALRRPIFSALLLALCLFAAPFGAQGQGTAFNPALPLTHVDNGPNSAWAQSQHYLVLVSLDGFRWDYAARDNATHLLALGKAGVWAPQGMLPSYPSLTFPNHYTLVTGLYPEHHGIVANNFLDPARNARYSMYDKQATNDGSWYGGVPLWSLAEGQGMRTACLLWVACEAKIAGFLPSYYATYDGKTQATPQAEQARIDDAITLLHLPAADRPHFIAIYFSEPDHTSHEFGPDARETRASALRMDALVGKLHAALATTGLPIDLVVVSDHGMAKSQGAWISLDQFADLSAFDAVGDLLYGKTEEDRDRVYNQLSMFPRNSWSIAARTCPPASITTRTRAKATPLSLPRDRSPFAPTPRLPVKPVARPTSACTASIRTFCPR